MKKIWLSVLICGITIAALAQDSTSTSTTTTTHKYYYYPSQNIYYDQTSGNYWYEDKGATKWTMTQTLPTGITVEKTPQYTINYNGNDPWKNNASDIKKFKIKKNGTVKVKMKDKDDQ